MSAEPAHEEMTVGQAVEVAWRVVAERRAETLAAAVDLLWPLPLAEDAHEALAKSGLIHAAHNAQYEAAKDRRPAVAFGAPHGKKWAAYMTTLSRPLEDADGREKRLLDFTAADMSAYRARCVTIGRGWLERAKVAERTVKVMERHGVRLLRDLPADVLAQVGDEFGEVFA